MGGVLSAAPVEQASLEHIRAGGDLCLICHKEDGIVASYEQLVRAAEKDRRFASRVSESARRTIAFKKRWRMLFARQSAPSTSKVEHLSRQLWEFTEEVRLAAISQQGAR
jgi:beta-glucosidase-like glycosyl hydrolase